MTHICVGNLTIIGSDNGLLPGRCQAITLTNAGLLLIGPLGTNFQVNLIQNSTIFRIIQENALQNAVCKMASILFRPQCVNTPGYHTSNHTTILCPKTERDSMVLTLFAILTQPCSPSLTKVRRACSGYSDIFFMDQEYTLVIEIDIIYHIRLNFV